MEMIRKLWNDESGQGLVEYGLIVGLVVAIVIAVGTLFRTEVTTVFNNLRANIQTADPGIQ